MGLGFWAPILGVLVVGLVMWGAYSLLGGASTNFGTAFSITSHAFLTGAGKQPTLYPHPLSETRTGTADLENPIAANLAAFLPDESSKMACRACASPSIFFTFLDPDPIGDWVCSRESQEA